MGLEGGHINEVSLHMVTVYSNENIVCLCMVEAMAAKFSSNLAIAPPNVVTCNWPALFITC